MNSFKISFSVVKFYTLCKFFYYDFHDFSPCLDPLQLNIELLLYSMIRLKK